MTESKKDQEIKTVNERLQRSEERNQKLESDVSNLRRQLEQMRQQRTEAQQPQTYDKAARSEPPVKMDTNASASVNLSN